MEDEKKPDEVVKKVRGNPFKPGHPRYGGRKKGSPIKRTKEAREIADKLGFHPVEFLATIASTGKMPNPDGTETPVSADMRLDAAKSIAPYILPKLQATQVTGVEEGPIQTQAVLPMQEIFKDQVLTDKLSDLALLMAGQDSGEETVN